MIRWLIVKLSVSFITIKIVQILLSIFAHSPWKCFPGYAAVWSRCFIVVWGTEKFCPSGSVLVSKEQFGEKSKSTLFPTTLFF